MYTDYRKAPNLMTAEMWKNVLEWEGLPTKILPEGRHHHLGRARALPDHGSRRDASTWPTRS